MKNKNKKILLVILLILVAAGVGLFFFVKYNNYKEVSISTLYENKSKDTASYVQCLDGILRYGRDGVALLTESGTELWNQSCQMNHPMVEMSGDSVAVGDKGGTSIQIFQKKGLKGEVKTPKTIEKFSVSSQGVVSAILKDEETPLVVCYDAVGNKLVEQKISPKRMGYPVDVALSADGLTLIVSYLLNRGTEITSKVVYYYFGDDYKTKKDYQIFEEEYSNTIIPMVYFMKNDLSVLIGDNAFFIYSGLKKINEIAKVEIDAEIQSVTHSDECIAMLVRGTGSSGQELKVFNTQGKMLCSVEIDKEYTAIKMIGEQIILFNGQSCGLYLKNGVCRYEGNVEQNIDELYPNGMLNKYVLINASGFYELKLVK